MAQSKNTKKITCPRCKNLRQKTVHHILPKVHFGERGEHGEVCETCHRLFEKILLLFEGKTRLNKRKKQPIWMYRLLWKVFLKTG